MDNYHSRLGYSIMKAMRCKIPSCDRIVRSLGLCGTHYYRIRNHGSPDPTIGCADLTGKRFGRLLVLCRYGSTNARGRNWKCLCDCGNIQYSTTSRLVNERTRSCGCLRREQLARLSRTHGMSESRAYHIWCGMWTRCTNAATKDWKNYGGRGISVCSRWEHFENFLLDMGEPPDATSIDRIDNDGNYEPTNCRWATAKQQQSNRRAQNPAQDDLPFMPSYDPGHSQVFL